MALIKSILAVSYIFEWGNVQMSGKVKCYQNAVNKKFYLSLLIGGSPPAWLAGAGAGPWGWGTWWGRSSPANTSSTSSRTGRSCARGSSPRRATSTSERWRCPKGEWAGQCGQWESQYYCFVETGVIFRRRRFLSDIFNTMLDMKWRYVHLAFFCSFIGSWLLFAVVWWVIFPSALITTDCLNYLSNRLSGQVSKHAWNYTLYLRLVQAKIDKKCTKKYFVVVCTFTFASSMHST